MSSRVEVVRYCGVVAPAVTQREGFKLLHQHRDGCHAERDEDGITFVLPDGIEWNLRRNGHKGGSTMWHRFRCNDTKCEAILLIRWDVLAAFVNGVDEEWFDAR